MITSYAYNILKHFPQIKYNCLESIRQLSKLGAKNIWNLIIFNSFNGLSLENRAISENCSCFTKENLVTFNFVTVNNFVG